VKVSTRTNITKPTTSLTERETTVLRAIQDDPEARYSFDFLVRKTGCSAEVMTIYFVQEAWGPKTIDGIHFGSFQKGPELRSFVAGLKRLVRRMREVNQLPGWKFIVPRIGLVDMAPGHVEKAFRTLPEMLLLYARNVETKVEALLSTQAESSPPHGKALELVFSEEISRWLEKKTGHRYRDHVAAIQRVTYREAGRKRLPASGETLRKRDLRRKKRY
jgi:hypothetical protein